MCVCVVIPQRQPAPTATHVAACLCLLQGLVSPSLQILLLSEASFALGDFHVEAPPSTYTK